MVYINDMGNQPQQFDSKLIRKTQRTEDTWSFYFERPDGFEFISGQYVKLFLEIENLDDRGVSRFFSIASSPTEENLMITTRIIKSSFKKALSNLKARARVQMRGPHGTFVLDENDLRPKVYLAGGIGITPARSMMIYSNDKKLDTPFTLIVSFGSENEAIFKEELNSIANINRKVVYVFTSKEGRIDEENIKNNVKNLNSLFYISGPTGFVEAMEKLVKNMGISEENIKTENFPGY